jgi:hypothetical protein
MHTSERGGAFWPCAYLSSSWLDLWRVTSPSLEIWLGSMHPFVIFSLRCAPSLLGMYGIWRSLYCCNTFVISFWNKDFGGQESVWSYFVDVLSCDLINEVMLFLFLAYSIVR